MDNNLILKHANNACVPILCDNRVTALKAMKGEISRESFVQADGVHHYKLLVHLHVFRRFFNPFKTYIL